MDFDDEPICACGNGSTRDGGDVIGVTCGMRRVEDDRQVGEVFQNGDGVDVGGVARGGLKGADAALAQDDLFVAARQKILGRHEQFFDGGAQPALEQYRFARFAQRAQEIEVLHVARAHLKDIHILQHQVKLRLRHDLDYDGHACGFARLGKIFETFLAEPLKRIRGRARFEDSAAQGVRPPLSQPGLSPKSDS